MFYLFLVAHLIADFVLQPLWLVRRKRRWDGLLIHVGLVLICMVALIPIVPAAAPLWPWMPGIAGVHLLADWWKVRYADQVVRPPVVGFIFDQVVHVATIALALSLALPPAQIWSLAAMSGAYPALVAAAYLIAGFAVPIGLIVALDPHFRHAAAAPAARLRAMLIATSVLSLALFGGPLALPITLLGMALINGHRATHPLDTTAGRLTVMLVAALLGAGIALW